MGWIICPNGVSVRSDKVVASVPYEYVIRDAQNERYTSLYRARYITIIGDIGLCGEFATELVPFLQKMTSDTDDNLRAAALYTLRKIFPKTVG